MAESIWHIEQYVVDLLQLDVEAGTPLLIGASNIKHMVETHQEDFEKYGSKIEEILRKPDYVSMHPTNGSIQYIKVYHEFETGEHVLVAARATKGRSFFIRSLFVMSQEKKFNYEKNGYLKAVKALDDTEIGNNAS